VRLSVRSRFRLWFFIAGIARCIANGRKGETMSVALLVLLALLVAVFVGLGFVVKWLFILAVVAALVWLVMFFMGRARA
jgi:hypothetical protein